jgi:hypothetical protein
MEWKIRTLEDAVRRVNGDRYADEIHDPLQSFKWKSDIAHYHACESERVIEETIASIDGVNKDVSGDFVVADAILCAGSSKAIVAAQFKAEAHIIASAQALHSLCDILSGIVYWCFQLKSVPKSPPVNRLNLRAIYSTLCTLPKYSATAKLINAAISSNEFTYLSAYVNTTKHKSLVSSTLTASFEADYRNGMLIKGFSYTDQRGDMHQYDHKWSHDFLFPENDALKLKLVAVGNSLNDYFNGKTAKD